MTYDDSRKDWLVTAADKMSRCGVELGKLSFGFLNTFAPRTNALNWFMAFDFAIFRGRLDWVNQPPSLDEKRAMENFIPRGTPYGGEKWQKRIAKKLGIESSHYDPEEGPGRQ